MVRIKPGINGIGASVGFYDGPPPVPGPYRGVVKKMGLAKIGSGPNAGADRIALLLEVTEGKYRGAGVWHSLNLTEQGASSVNQFLHALTDGSAKQRDVLEKWFWELGYDVEPEDEGKLGKQFNVIGKNFKPIGKPIAFMIKADSYNGQPKAAIDRFIVGSGNDEAEDVVEEPLSVVGRSDVVGESVSVGAETDPDDPWGN
jgi:hypothetical protein